MEDKKNDITENNQQGETKVSPVSFHNIYKNINISLKTLDFIIVILIIGLIVSLLFSLKNRGFSIEFDSTGGTAVESQKHYYGEKIDYVVPTRDGYKFDGWSLDLDCNNKWDENREIIESAKLYACWIEN